VAASEPGEGEKNITHGQKNNPGLNKSGGIKRGIKKGISEGINKGSLFKEKKEFTILFFWGIYDFDRFRRVYEALFYR